MQFFKRFVIVAIIVSHCVITTAQASFEIKTSDKQIGELDELQIDYVITNATTFSNFIPPVFNDWNIAQGPGYTEQSISINGQVQRTISYSYTLSPKKNGELSIPGASIVADGKRLLCDAVVIHVSKTNHASTKAQQHIQRLSQSPSLFDDLQMEDPFSQNDVLKANENPTEKIHNNIFVKVSSNKMSCFVGEPILVTYELYSALQSESKITKQPSFSGCSVIEMTTEEQPSMQKLNGKMYRVFLIRRVQLIPLQEGQLKMDVASVENNITFSSAENPFQPQNYTATINSNPLTIQVKALPEKNKPLDFSGIVGKFTISSKTENNRIAKGENNNLQIVIEGEGNLQGIVSPIFQWPTDCEHFDETDSQHLNKMSFPLSGSTTFNIPFINTKEGNVTIPEIHFSYFDPSTETYKTIHTNSINLIVTHALAVAYNLKSLVTQDVTNRRYLWIVPALALTVGLFWFVSFKSKKNKTKKSTIQKNNQTDKQPHEILQQPIVSLSSQTDFTKELSSLQMIEDNYTFFIQVKLLLTKALQEKVSSKTNIETDLITSMRNEMKNNTLTVDAENIYNTCNQCMYSPIISDDARTAMHYKLASLIEKLQLLS